MTCAVRSWNFRGQLTPVTYLSLPWLACHAFRHLSSYAVWILICWYFQSNKCALVNANRLVTIHVQWGILNFTQIRPIFVAIERGRNRKLIYRHDYILLLCRLIMHRSIFTKSRGGESKRFSSVCIHTVALFIRLFDLKSHGRWHTFCYHFKEF